MEKTNKDNEIYIDGKRNAIEILQHLTHEEREKILGILREKNQRMAQELEVQSYKFDSILHFHDSKMKTLLRHTSPAIIALSIANLDKNTQKRILRLMERSKAEKAFRVIKNRSTSPIESSKAQEKIVQIALELLNEKIIERL